jgi:hypothetical protein
MINRRQFMRSSTAATLVLIPGGVNTHARDRVKFEYIAAGYLERR